MMSKQDELVKLRTDRIAHLDSLIADIDRDKGRAPKLWYLALLAIPVTYFKGFALGVVSVVFVAAFVSVVYYILGGRREEYSRDRDVVKQDLESSLGARREAG